MSKSLDLSIFQEETFDIKFADGEMLHVKKPTEDLAIKILAHVNIKTDNLSAEEMLETTRDLTLSILNHNKDNKSYCEGWIKGNLPLGAQIAIIKGYTNFMTELEQNPN